MAHFIGLIKQRWMPIFLHRDRKRLTRGPHIPIKIEVEWHYLPTERVPPLDAKIRPLSRHFPSVELPLCGGPPVIGAHILDAQPNLGRPLMLKLFIRLVVTLHRMGSSACYRGRR